MLHLSFSAQQQRVQLFSQPPASSRKRKADEACLMTSSFQIVNGVLYTQRDLKRRKVTVQQLPLPLVKMIAEYLLYPSQELYVQAFMQQSHSTANFKLMRNFRHKDAYEDLVTGAVSIQGLAGYFLEDSNALNQYISRFAWTRYEIYQQFQFSKEILECYIVFKELARNYKNSAELTHLRKSFSKEKSKGYVVNIDVSTVRHFVMNKGVRPKSRTPFPRPTHCKRSLIQEMNSIDKMDES